MNRRIKEPFCFTLVTLLLAVIIPASGYGELQGFDTLHPGYGQFIFKYKPLADKPVTVYYYMPEGLPKDAPVMILLHGTLRNATTYRKNMASYAKRYNFLLIAPEFSKEKYPFSRDYHQGGVFKKDKTMKDKKVWTFSIIEPLFDDIMRKTGKTNEGYILYGFSAGSQFIHRFTWFVPDNRAIKTVSSSAGSYTMPDYLVNYPYGLKRTRIPAKNLEIAFAKDLTIVVGDADTVLAQKYLPKSDMAKKQGRDRLHRAKFFYYKCEKLATDKGIPFNWKLLIVPHVAHDNAKMAGPVTEMLFKNE